MTDDDRMDTQLRQMAAEEYNRPPEIVPRELMWDAVRAGLAGSAQGTGKGDVAPLSRGARIPRWLYLAAAAVALLAAGIQIGRRMGAGRSERPMAAAPGVPGARDTAAPAAGSPDVSPPLTTSRQVAVAEPNALERNAPARSDDGGSKPRPGPEPERSVGPSLPDDATARAYTVAAAQHLTQVEALLTTFKDDAAQGRMDAQLASWGKDLLSNTRLLLDSPAARDPVRRRLLQDLELVLVQIVQLSPGAPARDRDLITGALTDDHVLTRLRTAIPAQKGT